MLQLKDYGDSSDEDESSKNKLHATTSTDADTKISIQDLSKKFAINAAPDVLPPAHDTSVQYLDVDTKEITRNMKYEELFTPIAGPENPFKTQQQKAAKNMMTGFVEKAHISDFMFETQRRTFHSYGYALDPTVDSNEIIGRKPEGDDFKTVFESVPKRPADKRKRLKNDNPEDIEGYLGPWGSFVDEKKIAKPEGEDAAAIEEFLAKKQKRGKKVEDKSFKEKSILHIKDPIDYQGRSFLHIPQDVGVNLKSNVPPDRCFLPKAHIHTWQGHTKGISAIRWFPRSAHLLMSCSMDCKVKLWDVYRDRKCIRTYIGHTQAVRDTCFNNKGTKFLSAAYDRYVKLWDTETGDCIKSFTNHKVLYCVKFNPDEEKQHLFVAGTADKKIVCWDTRSGNIVQEYERHLGAVNSITFVDENRRFVTTSDDKSLRVWEWDIPVDMKYIADPTMHSMPSVTLAPNKKWLACQSMDNKVVIFSAMNRFKVNRKKSFSGHMVAGYACSLDFSPDMSYLVSGDADGKVFVWDWKTSRLYTKWKAHDNVCIAALWHPHEPSKVATAGWDGLIKYWD
ncbi:pre-mRNA-processing factor 17 [Adelges cooleyi]|uniref:pre-mRNA-processing factor 17 n=1 Tax=Adelges cooleyi TaxID=133065 RepID=UPI00217FF13B|nr:pre-mRNA-processing factor 17 [Adelges cooleyi]